MDRDEFLRQITRWTELVLEEAPPLFDNGLGPDVLMRTAIAIADARLNAEVMRRQQAVLAIPGALGKGPRH
jgi:hypothetical protein